MLLNRLALDDTLRYDLATILIGGLSVRCDGACRHVVLCQSCEACNGLVVFGPGRTPMVAELRETDLTAAGRAAAWRIAGTEE